MEMGLLTSLPNLWEQSPAKLFSQPCRVFAACPRRDFARLLLSSLCRGTFALLSSISNFIFQLAIFNFPQCLLDGLRDILRRYRLLLAPRQVLDFPGPLSALIGAGDEGELVPAFLGVLELLANLLGLGIDLDADALAAQVAGHLLVGAQV